MKNIYIIAMLFGLSIQSCYTTKQARKDIAKADVMHPQVTANFCAVRFPPKDSIIKEFEYIQGSSDTIIDFIELDCDTVTETKYKERKILVRVPKIITRVDTYQQTVTKFQENTAKIDLMHKVIREDFDTISGLYDKVDNLNKWIKRLGVTSGILLMLLIGLAYLKKSSLIKI